MFTDEQYAAHERALKDAKADAAAYVANASLPDEILISEASLLGIGRRGEHTATRALKQLQADCGAHLPEVIALAVRMTAYSLALGAAYIQRGQVAGLIGKNEYTDTLATVEGHGEIEGIAWSLYDRLHDNESIAELGALRSAINAVDIQKVRVVVMTASALNAFSVAAAEIRAGELQRGLDKLGEAFDAMALAEFDRGWAAAIEGKEEGRQGPSAFARMGADARHRENRSMREQVFSWLEDNMGAFSSMDAAAGAIAGKVVPVTWRTARDWVGQWKKNCASTPDDKTS